MELLRAVLLGGIAFETPPDSKQPLAANNQSFPLYRNFEDARAAGFGRQIRLLSNFPGSVAGLEGAHVTLHGLRIGEVTDVDLVYDPKLDRVVVPVHYRVEAGRIANIASAEQTDPEKLAEDMIKRGMRATLQSTSIITGRRSRSRAHYGAARRRWRSRATSTSSRPRKSAASTPSRDRRPSF